MQTTTSQTVGPYFKVGLEWLNCHDMAAEGVAGERVVIEGLVIDGDGAPVPDSFLEIWQANSHGKYRHPEDTQDKPLDPGFLGYGRVPTDKSGAFRFRTIKPGRVPGAEGKEQAPHLLVSVFMRGLLKRLVTRMYFPDDASNGADPILNLVKAERRHTVIARKASPEGEVLEWNIVLQGPDETVFFDIGL